MILITPLLIFLDLPLKKEWSKISSLNQEILPLNLLPILLKLDNLLISHGLINTVGKILVKQEDFNLQLNLIINNPMKLFNSSLSIINGLMLKSNTKLKKLILKEILELWFTAHQMDPKNIKLIKWFSNSLLNTKLMEKFMPVKCKFGITLTIKQEMQLYHSSLMKVKIEMNLW